MSTKAGAVPGPAKVDEELAKWEADFFFFFLRFDRLRASLAPLSSSLSLREALLGFFFLRFLSAPLSGLAP